MKNNHATACVIGHPQAVVGQGYAPRDHFLIFVRVHPAFAPLAADPRFERLLRWVGI